MSKDRQNTPLDPIKFWESIEDMQLDPSNVSKALAHSAVYDSKVDSQQVKLFQLFKPLKTYN